MNLAGVVLAAGAGTRLRPLTEVTPKALCPVAGVPLVDLALDRVQAHVADLAVNAHHHLDAMRSHLDGRVHLSEEVEQALGTAGAIGRLRRWLDGRDVLIANADAWSTDTLDRLVDGWDRRTIRLLVTYDPSRADFDGLWRFAGASLLPGSDAAQLDPVPSGLYEVCWRDAIGAGRVEFVPTTAAFVDCGTPRDYLAANLLASGGRAVIAADADVRGEVVASVVLPGARVAAGERLVHAIRMPDGRTLQPLQDS